MDWSVGVPDHPLPAHQGGLWASLNPLPDSRGQRAGPCSKLEK